MSLSAEQLASRVDALLPAAIKLRRRLHRLPELSGMEEKTAALVAQQCSQLGLEVETDIGGHGLIARLNIDEKLPWIAFRADMDALPIQDGKSSCSYASGIDRVTHACGHDVHTSVLLTTAELLVNEQRHLQHNVAFIFQPAEETCEGASAMLRDGLLRDFRPDQIYAMHVYPYLPSGSIGLRQGPMCAAADMFEVEITGRGGHAARPHECIDVILIASHVIQALHHIVSRRVNPLHPAVLTIGQISSGFAGNVIPDKIHFSGTVRSLHPDTHSEIRSRMDQIIRQTAEAWGATARFKLRQATPVLTNNPDLLEYARTLFQRMIPTAQLIDIPEPSMGGEDFAEFLQDVPGCLFRLGTGSGPETRYPLHHPCFDVDEQAMHSGIALFSALALNPPHGL